MEEMGSEMEEMGSDILSNFAIDISKWKTPMTDYPLRELRSARIRRENYKKGYYRNYGVRGCEIFRVVEEIPVTLLEIKDCNGLKNDEWETWMVDDPPHWWSMKDYAKRSVGRVLVAGLGLGLVVWGLVDNVDIDSVTVIEINKDVIELISPLLPIKDIDKYGACFRIINTDFCNFVKETDEDFDRIIVDIWTTNSKEETEKVYEEEVKPLAYMLKERFPEASVVFHGFGLGW